MQSFKPTMRIAAIQTCGLLIGGLLSTCCWAHPGHGIGGRRLEPAPLFD